MLNFTEQELRAIAREVLAMAPDPVPRFRLLRDVLKHDPVDVAYRQAASDLCSSKWVRLLADSQQPDGTWGRFHTQDTRVKQPFPTTESAVAAALDAGLDQNSPILGRVVARIVDYMQGRLDWPDPPEKHDNPLAWYVWIRHYSAAILALIDAHYPGLEGFWQVWAQVLAAAFQSGAYDRQAEIAALNDLLACKMKNPVPFHVRYPLLILSATGSRLPEDLERRMLDFLWRFSDGIYYVCSQRLDRPPPIQSRQFYPWFNAMRLLARFPLWAELHPEAFNWIWEQRTPQGFWDFGGQVSRRPFTCFPLSESWRPLKNRVIDSTVVVLGLLAQCFWGQPASSHG